MRTYQIIIAGKVQSAWDTLEEAIAVLAYSECKGQIFSLASKMIVYRN